MLETVVSVALGLSLAASCGLRAFMPLFVAALLARLFDGVELGENFEWLSSTPALITLGVAVVAEVAADKIPALDHALDVIQAPVRTIAGVVVAAAVMVDLPTWATVSLALVVGGGSALSVHSAKAAVRVGSTATTAGAANPLLSLLEDVVCFLASVLSVLFAVAAVIVSCLVLVVLVFLGRLLYRKLRARGDPAPAT
jgi:hypothetical protein